MRPAPITRQVPIFSSIETKTMGSVETLFKCHLGKRAIAQSEDQREMAYEGEGSIFAFDLINMDLLCDWTEMENWKGI